MSKSQLRRWQVTHPDMVKTIREQIAKEIEEDLITKISHMTQEYDEAFNDGLMRAAVIAKGEEVSEPVLNVHEQYWREKIAQEIESEILEECKSPFCRCGVRNSIMVLAADIARKGIECDEEN